MFLFLPVNIFAALFGENSQFPKTANTNICQCGKFKYTTARITSRDSRLIGCFSETPSSFCELITSTDTELLKSLITNLKIC